MTNLRIILRYGLFFLCICGGTAACSWFGGEEPKPGAESQQAELAKAGLLRPRRAAPRTTPVDVEKLKNRRSAGSVEMLWGIPQEPVEGYLIRYGYDKDNLENQIKVTSADLEKYEDPVLGFVYRYYLDDIPLNREVFVSIAAFSGETVSEASRLYEIPAAK